MTSRKGRKQWAGELPVETVAALREEADESDLKMWKIVDQALRMYLGLDEGSTEAALERKLDEMQKRREEIESQRVEFEREQERLVDEMDRLEAQLEEIREQKASYEEQLDTILDQLELHPERTVMAYMSEIRDASIDQYGRDTSDNISRVISDLQDRSAETDRGLPKHRFKRSSPTIKSDAMAEADGSGGSNVELKYLQEGDDQ